MATMSESLPQTQPSQATEASDRDLVIKCIGLTKLFRDFWLRNRVTAVSNVDLDVRRGEVFGLLGPNGSGKSTTIKMILGLLHPTAGRIAVFGRHPRDVATKQDIGYLPEESYLYRFLNARETLDYYGKLFHQDRRQRRRRTDMLLEMVGLDRVASRPVGEFSKGMQRRIGLAQALINDPKLLVLDEPTTGLDPIGTKQIKDLIIELSQRGKTILLCSHLLADVEDVTDRVAIMFGGRVRQAGTIEQMLIQSGQTNITTDALDDDDLQAVEQALASRGKHIERTSHPRQRLEELFLDIVHQAQTQGAATSGATSGGQIADFLRDSAAHLPEQTDSKAVLDNLMSPATDRPMSPGALPPSTHKPTSVPNPQQAPEHDAVIGELTGQGATPDKAKPDDQAAPSTPAADAGKSQDKARDDDADEDLINSLVDPKR